MAKAAKQSKPAKRKGGKGSSLILWAFMFVMVMIAFPGIIMLLFIGMLPTVVAYIIDRTQKKYATFCVGAMNLSGVFPFLSDLWTGNNNIHGAIEIMTNAFDLIVMYAAASFGWLLYIAVPPVVNALLAVAAQHRIAQLRSRQRELIREWGQEITVSPQDKVPPANGVAGEITENGEDNGASNGNGVPSIPKPEMTDPNAPPVLTEITGSS